MTSQLDEWGMNKSYTRTFQQEMLECSVMSDISSFRQRQYPERLRWTQETSLSQYTNRICEGRGEGVWNWVWFCQEEVFERKNQMSLLLEGYWGYWHLHLLTFAGCGGGAVIDKPSVPRC